MPDVGLIMGSQSDWPMMKQAAAILEKFQIDYEKRLFQLIACTKKCLPMRKRPNSAV